MIPLANLADDTEIRKFCEAFMAPHSNVPRLILGTNALARTIAENTPADGFIDEINTARDLFLDLPVHHALADVPEDALVVSAVTLARPQTVIRKLRKHGLKHLDYFSFERFSGLNLPKVLGMTGFSSHFNENKDQYDDLYRILADDISKSTLRDIVNFRLSQDIRHMSAYEDRQDVQYFEDFLDLKPEGETFVDVGGYDGYTSAFFMSRCPGFNTVHIFEPEAGNAEKIRSRFAGQEQVHLHPVGLSDAPATLRFSRDGSASRISDHGDESIQVARLDDTLDAPYTFMKMDIEGAEGCALAGAEQSIVRHRPRLAISAYHRHDDLLAIPRQVLSMVPEYRVYLRHYTEGMTETVMFFLP